MMARLFCSSSKRGALLVGFAFGLNYCSSAIGTVTATWLSATSGNWEDPTKWSTNPSYPNSSLEDVQINVTGSPYIVSLSEPAGSTDILVNNLNLNAEVDIPETSQLEIWGTANLGPNGVIRLIGQQNQLEINGGALNGQGEIIFDASYSNDFGNVSFAYMGTCTFGPGITLTTGTANGDINSGTLINEGTVLAKNGRTLIASLQNNSGNMEATTGGTLYVGGTWTNTGTIVANGATLKSYVPTVAAAGNFEVLDGRFELESSTTIAAVDALDIQNSVIAIGLVGGLNNTNTTLNIEDGTNTWHLIGGIFGGSIYAPSGAALEVEKAINNFSAQTSNLSNVQVNADMVLDSGADLNLNSGTTISGHTIRMTAGFTSFGPPTTLTINSGVALSNGTSIVLNGGSNENYIATSSVPAGASVVTGTGGGTIYGGIEETTSTLAISGSVSSITPGYSLTLSAANVALSGLLEASQSSINIPSYPSTFSGVNPAIVSNDGTVELGAGGLLNIGGTFSQTNAGIAEFELDGTATGLSGDLETTGNTELGGELLLFLSPGYRPNIGDQFMIITTTGGTINGNFGNVVLDTNGQDFAVSYGQSSVTVTAIPEPSCILLWTGVSGFLLSRRARREKPISL